MAQDARPRRPGTGDSGRKSAGASNPGSGLGNYEKPPPANDIPAHPFDIVLGRPTDTSIELRILQNSDGQGHVEYSIAEGDWLQSPVVNVTQGQPVAIRLQELKSNTAYRYRWVFKSPDNSRVLTSPEYSFHTQRATGSSFVFSVTADSHLDENSSGEVYLQTLRNAAVDRPDLHFELGDTFMTGKYVKPEYAYGQYLAQRYYLSQLCNSTAFYFVVGNHDGESAGRGSIAWATATRKSLFPNPYPNDFYSGNAAQEPMIGYPENYYAWQWGDAQFIVLDPYRYTQGRRRGGRGGQVTEDSNWYWTLGEDQYRWLQKELLKPSKFRFVFIHHLVGGAVQNQRGGIEVAKLWEWGGHNTQGAWEFDEFRTTWEKPIHQLLIQSGVSIVFHGHDHFFAKQDLDGIVYQEVPQPSHARAGNVRNASEYGYLAGEFQPSSGYVRVRVEPDKARVDYVRTSVADGKSVTRNGEVTYSYEVKPK